MASLGGFLEGCVRIHVCYDGGSGTSNEHGILALEIGFYRFFFSFFLYDGISIRGGFFIFILFSILRCTQISGELHFLTLRFRGFSI